MTVSVRSGYVSKGADKRESKRETAGRGNGGGREEEEPRRGGDKRKHVRH